MGERRLLTDLVLVPGRKISNELAGQQVPNLGAGFMAASTCSRMCEDAGFVSP